jgi:hypothetical protein
VGTPLSLEQQARLLRRWFPKVRPRFETIDGQRQLWFALSLQPTPTNAVYRVRFGYALRCRPHVYVIDPEPVREAHGQSTPHLNGDGTLCLYDPTKQQWTGMDPLVYTTVQWTSRWLFHYEHWLAFGEWRGDHEPDLTTKPADNVSTAEMEIP